MVDATHGWCAGPDRNDRAHKRPRARAATQNRSVAQDRPKLLLRSRDDLAHAMGRELSFFGPLADSGVRPEPGEPVGQVATTQGRSG